MQVLRPARVPMAWRLRAAPAQRGRPAWPRAAGAQERPGVRESRGRQPPCANTRAAAQAPR
eukprot:12532676-Alexandrium_andersonii.AAC.1